MGARAIVTALPIMLKQKARKEAYDVYVADCMRILTKNTAKMVGGEYIDVKITDIIAEKKPSNNKSGEEIAADVLRRLAD